MNLQSRIRNFCIIAHIDHGKSTLADTIKAQAVRLKYKSKNDNEYILNLIDTPGHVDFSYEVSRSLAACEGAILVIDAAQGIEAQTLANFNLALECDLTIIPVINKIDLPAADVERVKKQIEDVLGIEAEEAIPISAKKGTGTEAVLEAVVEHIPPPNGDPEKPLKALVFDSFFDSYQGAVPYMKVIDGEVKKDTSIMLMSNQKTFEVSQVGYFSPQMTPCKSLSAGEVGFLFASIKNVRDVRVGDTVTLAGNPTKTPFPGYQAAKSMVFCGLYPIDSGQYELLRTALEKMGLNDAAFCFEPESSVALGFGFRCGFLGLLHLEIVRERLEREFDVNLLTTAPTVVYKIILQEGEDVMLHNPSLFPPVDKIERIEEPIIRAGIIMPDEYVGGVLKLLQEKRGEQKGFEYLGTKTVMVTYEMPLNEMVVDFYDRLKSVSKGYASFDYEVIDFRGADLVKIDILINGQPVDALSMIVHRHKAATQGRKLLEKMREIIPRQMYEVILQCSIGSRIIGRETIKAMRKNVTSKCYGGDITRKRKLLEKQKEGKKRMKQVGRIEIPQEAFMAILKMD
jgi:GTP-binding protein LepA